jgi:hypothetical protein
MDQRSAESAAAFREAIALEAAISEHESIWRGRVVWRHQLAKATVAVSPYFAVTRSGPARALDVRIADIRDAIRAKWERAGAPLDIASGISANDPQLAEEIEIELLFEATQ